METISGLLAIAINQVQQGQLALSEQTCRSILSMDPNQIDAWNLLGVIKSQLGSYDQGVACLQRALQLNPNSEQVLGNLGNALACQGRNAEAELTYLKALELNPQMPQIRSNLGDIFLNQGKVGEAIASYQIALQYNPNLAETLCNLGYVLALIGREQESELCYERSLQLKPDRAKTHCSRAERCADRLQHKEAIHSYRQALRADSNLATAKCCLIYQLQQVCQWEDQHLLAESVIDTVTRTSIDGAMDPVPPFGFLVLPVETSAEQQLRNARQWASRNFKAIHSPAFKVSKSGGTKSARKIKIGYLSADYHGHATSSLIAELFEKHDRNRFAIIGYSCGQSDNSSIRQRIVSNLDEFVEVGSVSCAEAAKRISEDEVGILVDLKGYTHQAKTEILALRPAPIQVNYLGYPGTMGAPFIDYILVDDFIVGLDQQDFFTEKLVHLPGCYQVNDSRREISAKVPTRQECGLPETGFVFCCFNNNYKITTDVFGVWMELLQAIPDSVLWLLDSNEHVGPNLRREAESRGVVGSRLVFAPRLPPSEHLARHRLADLFVDTFPVNAHTTASDALWAGCPLLTLAGSTFISRVAGSLLRSVGLSEMIATSLNEYREKALCFARQPERLKSLRARLQNTIQQSPLFDGAAFAKNIEMAYTKMWELHTSGESPRAFTVHPSDASQ
jgi:protein O-GlcNAc transferase